MTARYKTKGSSSIIPNSFWLVKLFCNAVMSLGQSFYVFGTGKWIYMVLMMMWCCGMVLCMVLDSLLKVIPLYREPGQGMYACLKWNVHNSFITDISVWRSRWILDKLIRYIDGWCYWLLKVENDGAHGPLSFLLIVFNLIRWAYYIIHYMVSDYGFR